MVLSIVAEAAELTFRQAMELVSLIPRVQAGNVPRKYFRIEASQFERRLIMVRVFDARGVGAGTGSGIFGMYFVDKFNGVVYESVPYEHPVESTQMRRLRGRFFSRGRLTQ